MEIEIKQITLKDSRERRYAERRSRRQGRLKQKMVSEIENSTFEGIDNCQQVSPYNWRQVRADEERKSCLVAYVNTFRFETNATTDREEEKVRPVRWMVSSAEQQSVCANRSSTQSKRRHFLTVVSRLPSLKKRLATF